MHHIPCGQRLCTGPSYKWLFVQIPSGPVDVQELPACIAIIFSFFSHQRYMQTADITINHVLLHVGQKFQDQFWSVRPCDLAGAL